MVGGGNGGCWGEDWSNGGGGEVGIGVMEGGGVRRLAHFIPGQWLSNGGWYVAKGYYHRGCWGV